MNCVYPLSTKNILISFTFLNSGMSELIGIIIGHLYFFLKFQYPQQYGGASLLGTPSIFEDWFPPQRGGVSGFGMAPPSRPAAPAGGAGAAADGGGVRRNMFGHQWGRGHQLGQ